MAQDRESYEYHLTLLSVRMRVKFPCKMKVQHRGNLMTAEIPSGNNDNKYIFNQDIVMKSSFDQKECFEFILHLVTDKGARYIGGVVKLYHSEMIRSEGEKLSLSLAKCVDPEAFCEIRVNRVLTQKDRRSSPFDRKSNVSRNIPSFKPKEDSDVSPFKSNMFLANQESRSEYNFPVARQTNQKQEQWDNRTKNRYFPPAPSTHSRIKTPSKYTQQQEAQFYPEESSVGLGGRERELEAEAYKQGYQKLKEKYRKEAQVGKQQLNKRLALETSENNLKLQVMRLRLKLEEQQKMLNEKTAKIKELQNSLSGIKQKEGENSFLHEELRKKESAIQALENTIISMNTDLTELREMTRNKSTEESYKLRQLRAEIQNLKIKLENKEKQLEHEAKIRKEIIFEKDHELSIKQEQIDRNRKLINDLEKGVQTKNYDLEKMLQNDRSINKNKIEQQKTKIQRLQKQISAFSQQRREFSKKVEELKAANIKMEYEKRLISQQYDSLQQESNDYRSIKEKYSQLQRENKKLSEERSDLQIQIQRLIQSKETEIVSISQQLKDQNDHFLTMIRQMEDKQRKKSSQVIQSETKLEQYKSQQEKMKKTIDSLTREVEEYKERQKNAKKALKNREQDSLGIETEYATLKQKIKNIDQIYKLQADKIKDEAQKYRTQLQENIQKNAQLTNNINAMNEEMSRIKAKLQYAEERSQRDSNNLKEKQQQIQNLFKDTHQQIADLEKTVTTLRTSQKDLSNKLQKLEVETMRKDEKIEKSKRDLRVYEEKCNNLESSLKGRNYQLEALNSQKDFLQTKLNERQQQLNNLQSEYLSLTAQKSKLFKIHELLQQNMAQCKEQVARYQAIVEQKDQKEGEMMNGKKQERQEFIKLQFSFNSLKKEYERNKELVYQSIQKYITALVTSQSNLQQSRSKKTKELSFADIAGLIANNGKQLKQIIAKINDESKQIQKQKDRLQQQLSNATNRSQTLQNNLNNHISQLQEELQKVYEEKESENKNFTIIINQLNEKIKEKDYLEEELNTQIEELNFTINSVKLDCDAINEQNTKKMGVLRKINIQWQEKSENLLMTIAQIQQKNRKLEEYNESLQLQLQSQLEISSKRDKAFNELQVVKRQNEIQLVEIKKKNKQLVETLADCEMYLAAEKEVNEKLKESIESEQRTCSELKTFIAQLMKQKQLAIKNDLQKNETITTLESSILQKTKDIQLLQQENQKIGKQLESQKETSKKLAQRVKQLQTQLKQECSKHAKSQQKLREKQKEVVNKEETIKRLEQKYEKLSEKTGRQIKELQQELSHKTSSSSQQSKESSERISYLQNQLQRRMAEINQLDIKANNFEEELFRLNEKHLKLQEEWSDYKTENEELKLKINFLDSNINELTDQIKERQEKLFDFSGKNYNLQLKLQSKQKEMNVKIQEISNDWSNKFDAVCEEYEQRVELVEKQRDYFKHLSEERDKEVTKMTGYLKVAQNSQNATRRSFQEQIKRLQEDKLAISSAKNIEIQRLNEEIRSMAELLKSKQSQLRRNLNELDIARKTISNFDVKSRESDEKTRSMIKIYQTEIQQLKKKDTLNKTLKESYSNHLWNSERETKKNMQNFIRNFLEVSEDKNSQKVIELVRVLENSIIEALSFNFNQK